jgi:hypothetical protein
MRGESKIQTGMETHGKPVFEGGTYTFDKAFKKGQKFLENMLKNYGRKIWKNNL